MAEAWGMHPQDIMDRPGGVLWARRYRIYQDELHEIRKREAKQKA
jgi:hypothetical protein